MFYHSKIKHQDTCKGNPEAGRTWDIDINPHLLYVSSQKVSEVLGSHQVLSPGQPFSVFVYA